MCLYRGLYIRILIGIFALIELVRRAFLFENNLIVRSVSIYFSFSLVFYVALFFIQRSFLFF